MCSRGNATRSYATSDPPLLICFWLQYSSRRLLSPWHTRFNAQKKVAPQGSAHNISHPPSSQISFWGLKWGAEIQTHRLTQCKNCNKGVAASSYWSLSPWRADEPGWTFGSLVLCSACRCALFIFHFLFFIFCVFIVSEGGGERAGRFSSWSADLLATLSRVIPVIAAKAARKNKWMSVEEREGAATCIYLQAGRGREKQHTAERRV